MQPFDYTYSRNSSWYDMINCLQAAGLIQRINWKNNCFKEKRNKVYNIKIEIKTLESKVFAVMYNCKTEKFKNRRVGEK